MNENKMSCASRDQEKDGYSHPVRKRQARRPELTQRHPRLLCSSSWPPWTIMCPRARVSDALLGNRQRLGGLVPCHATEPPKCMDLRIWLDSWNRVQRKGYSLSVWRGRDGTALKLRLNAHYAPALGWELLHKRDPASPLKGLEHRKFRGSRNTVSGWALIASTHSGSYKEFWLC